MVLWQSPIPIRERRQEFVYWYQQDHLHEASGKRFAKLNPGANGQLLQSMICVHQAFLVSLRAAQVLSHKGRCARRHFSTGDSYKYCNCSLLIIRKVFDHVQQREPKRKINPDIKDISVKLLPWHEALRWIALVRLVVHGRA